METQRRRNALLVAVFGTFLLVGCSPVPPNETPDRSSERTEADPPTLAGEKHLLRDYPPLDAEGLLNVVVEIPAGTNAKWEVNKSTGRLQWQLRDGQPRIVSYLAYPGNYGMVPRTLLPEELGGDGDPLDVIVLGPSVPRGTLLRARLLGVLKLLDNGEQDDKLIAVQQDAPLGQVADLDQLNREYPGVAEILEIWFRNYKGPGETESKGFGDRSEAASILQAAVAAYREP
jgi:inorganic pyrophosphatase